MANNFNGLMTHFRHSLPTPMAMFLVYGKNQKNRLFQLVLQ